MNSLIVLFIGVVVFSVGYFIYARSINKTVMQPDEKKATPAKMFMDGVDFTPANRNVLFGYQFKSIAALGPILGPIIAAQWGWLPGLIWIVLGTLFIGWVQDYTSVMIGVREEGRSFGALSYRLISPRSRMILLIFIYFYLWMLMGAYGTQIAFTFFTNPIVPLGVIIVMALGVLAGQMTYRWKMDIILTTIITVVLSFVGIYISTLQPVQGFFNTIYGVTKTAAGAASASPTMFLTITQAKFFGSLLMILIIYLGSVLPIWRFAQPINFVAFWIVIIGILAGVIGLLVWHPSLGNFPAITTFTVAGLGPLWPILFVTIACGAISGWHSLVSSSGTARQLEKETDALYVGGGSMFLEMGLAIISLLTATVALGGLQGFKSTFAIGAGAVFSNGLAAFMNKIGVPLSYGQAYGGIFLTLMALTIMYLVVRFMRTASSEALGDKLPAMKNIHIGTIVALIVTLILIWLVPFLQIWVLFGAANQMMASLALLLVTLWLKNTGKNYRWTFVPFIFMFLTTIGALAYNAYNAFAINLPNAAALATKQHITIGQVTIANVIIGAVAIVLILTALILAWDGLKAFSRPEVAQPIQVSASAD